MVRKGEIACYKQFLLFSQCFLPYMVFIFHPQLSGGIEIAQLSHYSRGTTPPLCLPVCRGLRPVSPDDGILVVEWPRGSARPCASNTPLWPQIGLNGRSGRPILINRLVMPCPRPSNIPFFGTFSQLKYHPLHIVIHTFTYYISYLTLEGGGLRVNRVKVLWCLTDICNLSKTV